MSSSLPDDETHPGSSAKNWDAVRAHPDEQLSERAREVVIATLEATYASPLPPAAEIERLDQIQAGLGTKLIEKYLAQRNHQREMERAESDRLVLASSRFSRAQVLGFYILAMLAVLSGCAMYLRAFTLAAVFFSAPALALVYSLFAVGSVTRERKKE